MTEEVHDALDSLIMNPHSIIQTLSSSYTVKEAKHQEPTIKAIIINSIILLLHLNFDIPMQ